MSHKKLYNQFLTIKSIKSYVINNNEAIITDYNGDETKFEYTYALEKGFIDSMIECRIAIMGHKYEEILKDVCIQSFTHDISGESCHSSKSGKLVNFRIGGDKKEYLFNNSVDMHSFYDTLILISTNLGSINSIFRKIDNMKILMKKYNKMPELKYIYRSDGTVCYCNIIFKHNKEKLVMMGITEQAATRHLGIMDMLKDDCYFNIFE